MMRIHNFLVPLQEIQGLTFNYVPLFEDIDKNIWQVAVLQLRRSDTDIVLPGGVVLHLKVYPMGFLD